MNHVALLAAGKGRAGSDSCSIRLDADDAQEVAEAAASEAAQAADAAVAAASDAMEAASEAAAAAEAAAPAPEVDVAQVSMLAELNATITQLRERVASLESLLTQAVTRADSAESKVFAADVAAALPELDTAGQTPDQIRALVVGRYLPAVRLDGASAEYSRAMFDAAVSVARAGTAAPKKIAGNEITPPRNGAADARAEMIARNRAACKVS